MFPTSGGTGGADGAGWAGASRWGSRSMAGAVMGEAVGRSVASIWALGGGGAGVGGQDAGVRLAVFVAHTSATSDSGYASGA